MVLPPSHPNKTFAAAKKIKNRLKNVAKKSKISPSLIRLARKLQNTIEPLNSSDENKNYSSNYSNINSNDNLTIHNKNIQNFESIDALDTYMRTVCLKFKKTHSNEVNCSACRLNHDTHKMTQIYYICQCGESDCGLGWRAIRCGKHEDLSWCLYQAGDLHEIPKDFKQQLRADGKKVPHSQDIGLHIKKNI